MYLLFMQDKKAFFSLSLAAFRGHSVQLVREPLQHREKILLSREFFSHSLSLFCNNISFIRTSSANEEREIRPYVKRERERMDFFSLLKLIRIKNTFIIAQIKVSSVIQKSLVLSNFQATSPSAWVENEDQFVQSLRTKSKLLLRTCSNNEMSHFFIMSNTTKITWLLQMYVEIHRYQNKQKRN